jgi:hypothetical protein
MHILARTSESDDKMMNLLAWFALDEQMPRVNQSFSKVRNELLEVGLLDNGVYLDEIELHVTILPSILGEAGYVYEKCHPLSKLLQYKEGVIYLPSDLPSEAYVPGGTLTDVIRHEYGHCWHWLEPDYFDRPWFRKSFGNEYDDPNKLHSGNPHDDFVSEYAMTNSAEDFCETFMMYLRYRNSLGRFTNRPGVHRKIRAVEKAVRVARVKLGQ